MVGGTALLLGPVAGEMVRFPSDALPVGDAIEPVGFAALSAVFAVDACAVAAKPDGFLAAEMKEFHADT